MSNNFSKIQKVEFVKNYVLSKNDGLCALCGYWITGDFLLLHNGTKECKTSDTISVSVPTVKNPNKKRNLPDCELCSRETPKEFYGCISKLYPVHRGCAYNRFNLDK